MQLIKITQTKHLGFHLEVDTGKYLALHFINGTHGPSVLVPRQWWFKARYYIQTRVPLRCPNSITNLPWLKRKCFDQSVGTGCL